jgi:hypothetical protein
MDDMSGAAAPALAPLSGDPDRDFAMEVMYQIEVGLLNDKPDCMRGCFQCMQYHLTGWAAFRIHSEGPAVAWCRLLPVSHRWSLSKACTGPSSGKLDR